MLLIGARVLEEWTCLRLCFAGGSEPYGEYLVGGRRCKRQKSEQRRLVIIGLLMYWTIGNMLACGSIIIATSNNNDNNDNNDNDNDNVNNNSKKSQIATSMS
jgi:hypothetical protein